MWCADADYFYSKIRELDNSKARISHEVETQTNIIKSIIGIVNDSLIEIEIKQNSLLEKITHLKEEKNLQKIELVNAKFEVGITEGMTLLNLILSQFAYETENLVEILNSALQGVIHSSLLDIKSIVEQLKDIKIQLPIELGIPVKLSNSGVMELLFIYIYI